MSKVKGSRTERELINLFWENGWGCSRVAGSGSTTLPSPDILAGKPGKTLAIECKSGKSIKYISEEQINELIHFSLKFGAEALVGIRFDRQGWYFLKPNQIPRTKTGVYSISPAFAKENGETFEELIKD